MARHPEWFERLDGVIHVLQNACSLESLGRKEIRAVFDCSERDAIRLLHRFGAAEVNDALALSRTALLAQIEAVRNGPAYSAYLRRRVGVATELNAAREEAAARRLPVSPVPVVVASLDRLPPTITWRRSTSDSPGRFEIRYCDGEDLLMQIASFLTAAAADREVFFAGTEPADKPE